MPPYAVWAFALSCWIGLSCCAIASDDDAPTIDQLIEQFEDSDLQTRRDAVYELARRGAESAAAIPALIKGLDDRDDQIWFQSALAIARIGPPAHDATAALIENLDDRAVERARVQGDWNAPVASAALHVFGHYHRQRLGLSPYCFEYVCHAGLEHQRIGSFARVQEYQLFEEYFGGVRVAPVILSRSQVNQCSGVVRDFYVNTRCATQSPPQGCGGGFILEFSVGAHTLIHQVRGRLCNDRGGNGGCRDRYRQK